SSPRATPTPEIEESPTASMRSNGPVPAINPRCGGCAGGKDGTRRRVRTPCTATNGNRGSEPRRPAASLARRRPVREAENAWLATGWSPEPSPKLTAILIRPHSGLIERRAAPKWPDLKKNQLQSFLVLDSRRRSRERWTMPLEVSLRD